MRRGAATAAALAAGLLAAGCGGGSEPAGAEQVEAYVAKANAAQDGARPVFDAANRSYEAFAEGDLQGRKAELELRQREIDLAGLQERVAALDPPAPARELHRLLLRTYDMNVALAAETRQMAGYVPRSERALKGLDDVRKRLRDRLRRAETAPEQTAALGAYARRLDAVAGELRELEVPPVLRGTHDGQLARLADTRGLARRLAAAITAQDAAAVARLLKRFREAGGPDPVTERLAVGGIRAYQQRVVALTRASADVRREQARLLRPEG